MTDISGARARWRAIAVLAPATAALFAGTTAWAAQHDPTAGGTTTGSTPAPAAGADQSQQALLATIAADEARLAELQQRLEALAKGCLPGTPAPAGAATTGKAPAPAPPAHTTTGASGAKK